MTQVSQDHVPGGGVALAQPAPEATGINLMRRVYGNSGADITQATITSIAYSVSQYASYDDAWHCTNGTAVIAGGSLVKTSVVFDTLQTAAPWDSTANSTGYNFRYDSPATDRPAVTGGGTYWHRYDVVFTPTSGAVFVSSWIVPTTPRI
jgi:hypothetical protein